ncbi:MAG: DUF11 domain-containing protein [Anaplasmataceae bacterium]|nr:DUF11 domain-containing protein [Anaplasmataceae bacterium]
MPIGYGNNLVRRLTVGLIVVALLFSSFGPAFTMVRAEDVATSTETVTEQENQVETITPSEESSTQETSEAAEQGETIIDTGDAGGLANLLNVVNTNIIDAQTFFAFLNYLNGHSGDIVIPWDENGLVGCENGCFEGDINIENNNEANIQNDVTVIASTGGNNILNNGGTSSIVTGNAYAAANIANLINSNIINANYLLVAINSFNHLNGSLILPPASFFNQETGGVTTQQLAIENNNGASVNNNVTTDASTGENEISGDGSGVILTGNSAAISNVTNMVNTNHVNADKMFILVRVTGDWAGNVFSAPPGLSWMQTPEGILLYSEGALGENENDCCGGSLSVTNNNGASVNNNVEVYALTGDNKIESEEGESVIATGDAAAVANVFNMVNSNVVGRNWLFAMVNVFGNWNGNLSFGQPDLWVGARAEVVSDPVGAGDLVTYIIDVVNMGNTAATNIKLRSTPQRPDLFSYFGMNRGGGIKEGGVVEWNLQNLAPGASTQFTYQAKVGDGLPNGTTLATNQISVQGYEPESNNGNNQESISLALYGNPVFVGRSGGSGNGIPRITLTKTNNSTSSTIAPGATVTYKLEVRNEGNASTFDTILTDVLRDPYGRAISTNSWDLGIVRPGERIYIDYDVQFSNRAGTGHYINYASLVATDDFYHSVARLPRASSSVYLVNPSDTPSTPTPVAVNPTVYVGADPDGDDGGGSSSGGSSPTPPKQPTPPTPPSNVSDDDLFDASDEEIYQDSGVEIISNFEPVREDTPEESLLQATTSFLRSKLLASFSFLPSGAWVFFLLLLLLIAIIGRSLLQENK